MDRERRLPPFADDALTVLTEAVGDRDSESDGLPKDEAKALLADDDRFSESDAAHALDMLDNRGRIYYVDDRVRITPTEK
ncbi:MULTISPECIES: hypothetical protein [Halococcus]|uniref:Uncharacterized protein n=1 Tax=Halococcus saccharolyticus DSM 5350 TaxID=1227455 RepID=M0MFY5_9EURY|nr:MULTISPECIES: hypothetical protein [Halococcus]EMA43589.1 hypothetical protein C449_13557 [Halococcus saccharolyticus DSM 5350]